MTTDMPTEAPRRLTRSRDDRIVAGVCSGAAQYFDIDPVIPRVLLAVLAVFGGAGIAIYAFAWLLVPEAGSPTTRLERWLENRGGDRGRDLLIVVVALLSLWFLVDTHSFAHRISGGALTVIVVMVVAALVSRRRFERRGMSPPPDPSPVAPPMYGPTAQPFGPPPAPTMYDAPTTAWAPTVAMPRREHSWLPWLTLGLTVLAAGCFAIAAGAGWANPQPVDILTACLVVVGLGVLVGAFFGRAWSMIPLGVVLVVGLLVANALPRGLTWSAGDRHWSTSQSNPAPFVLGAGRGFLTLSDLPRNVTSTITTRMGAGDLVIVVPRNVTVNLHSSVSAGRVEAFDREADGTGVHLDQVFSAGLPTAINLTVEMGYGDVSIDRVGAGGASRSAAAVTPGARAKAVPGTPSPAKVTRGKVAGAKSAGDDPAEAKPAGATPTNPKAASSAPNPKPAKQSATSGAHR